MMEFLDFELEIGSGAGQDYPISIVRSPAGEVHETMHFPFDELALENHLLNLQIALLRSGGRYRQTLSPEEQTVQNFGQALFDALMNGNVYRYYEVSQHEANYQGKGLRVKLRIHDPALAALPWEFLYDREQGEYVCLSSNTPIVRYIELPQSPQPLTVTPPLCILGMAPSPKDLPRLDIEREKQRMEEAIKDLQANNLARLTWLQDNTWQSLQRALRAGPWHIFHFVGHGDFNATLDEGLIVLEDEEGKANYLRASHLARLLNGHRPLRLVVLNSCEGARGSTHDIFSSTAAILVRRGIPAVLAMQYGITDRAAIELARVFYEALADGLPVDMAIAEARKAISLKVTNTLEWGTPVLYMRSPNGVLFDLVGEPSKPSVPLELSPAGQAPAATLPPQSIQEPLPALPFALSSQNGNVMPVPAGGVQPAISAPAVAPTVKPSSPVEPQIPVKLPPQQMPAVPEKEVSKRRLGQKALSLVRIGGSQAVAIGLGILLYALCNYALDSLDKMGSPVVRTPLSLFDQSEAGIVLAGVFLVIPLFVAAIDGPIAGLLTAAGGAFLGDLFAANSYVAGYYYEVSWGAWLGGQVLIGLIAGLAVFFTRGRYTTLRSLAIVFVMSAFGIAVGTAMAVLSSRNPAIQFTRLGPPAMVAPVLLLPLLAIYNAILSRRGS